MSFKKGPANALLSWEALIPTTTQAKSWFEQGIACYKAVQHKEALGWFRAALNAEPGNGGTHVAIACCHIERNESGEAKNHLNEAIKLNPDLAMAYFLRYEILCHEFNVLKADKRSEAAGQSLMAALADIKKVWELCPKNLDVITKLNALNSLAAMEGLQLKQPMIKSGYKLDSEQLAYLEV